MTRDEFATRYQLLQPVTTEGARTHCAVAPTGTVVMVHFLEREPKRLLSLVDALPDEDRLRIIEVTDVDGTPVVVTRFLLDFRSLPQWLAARAASAPEEHPSPSAAPEASRRGAGEPGEFTRLFRAVSEGEDDDSRAPSPEPTSSGVPPREPIASAPPGDGPDADAVPGEFTRLFKAVEPEEPGSSIPSPLPAPDRDSPRAQESGLREAGTDRAEEPGEAPPEADPPRPFAPGEFTRRFMAFPEPPGTAEGEVFEPAPSPSHETPPGAPPRAADESVSPALERPETPRQPTPEPPRDATPSLTQVFRSPPRSSPVAPESPPPAIPGPLPSPPPPDLQVPVFREPPARTPEQGDEESYRARLLSPSPRDHPAPPPVDAPLRAGSSPPPPRIGSPSEYTRVISAAVPPPVAPRVAPNLERSIHPVPPPPPPTSRRSLLIGLGVIAVLAVALVLFLVLRPPAPQDASDAPAAPQEEAASSTP